MSLSRVMFGSPSYFRHADRDLAARPVGELDSGIGDVGSVDEGHEPRHLLRVFDDALPLTRVALDVASDRLFELRGQAEGVVADDIPQVVQSALEALHPRRGALQP